jgi:hypothetical protein
VLFANPTTHAHLPVSGPVQGIPPSLRYGFMHRARLAVLTHGNGEPSPMHAISPTAYASGAPTIMLVFRMCKIFFMRVTSGDHSPNIQLWSTVIKSGRMDGFF